MPTEHGKKFVSVFDPQTIESFLSIRQTAGAKLATLQRYRNVLQSVVTFFGDELPESSQSTERWRDYLLQEGYALNTVNGMTSALNVYLAYIGRTDLCLRGKRVPKVPTNHSQPTQNLFDDGEIETFLNNRLAEGTGVMMMKRYRKDSVQCARFRGKSTADNGVDPSAVAGSSAKYWVCSEYGQFYDQCAEYLSYLHKVLRQTCPTSP